MTFANPQTARRGLPLLGVDNWGGILPNGTGSIERIYTAGFAAVLVEVTKPGSGGVGWSIQPVWSNTGAALIADRKTVSPSPIIFDQSTNCSVVLPVLGDELSLVITSSAAPPANTLFPVRVWGIGSDYQARYLRVGQTLASVTALAIGIGGTNTLSLPVVTNERVRVTVLGPSTTYYAWGQSIIDLAGTTTYWMALAGPAPNSVMTGHFRLPPGPALITVYNPSGAAVTASIGVIVDPD